MSSKKKFQEEVKDLQIFVYQMNDRLRQQEKYTRKDNVLIRNSPFDGRDEKLLGRNMKFFVEFLKIECFDRGGSKALLYVPKRKPLPYKLMPTV